MVHFPPPALSFSNSLRTIFRALDFPARLGYFVLISNLVFSFLYPYLYLLPHPATPLLIAASSQAQVRSQWCDYDEVCKHVLEQGGREYKCSGKAGAWGCRIPRLHACALPTLSTLSMPASRARTLAPPAPPLSVAEGVEPAHIDTTGTNANTAPHAWPSVEDIRKCTNTIMGLSAAV
ncbi:hypothetical protein DFH08DRAFT_961798 [Mycena albidolilacea]|uniref:Uncharacterized protein n=1 Tax=Mycena albidolilacea TaxID=1033008 RepID=A0AAD7EQJ2_9AGAR|nr:hypothetical protein DFH08DRAFT_961798 [Mycena albidolilacea]